VPRCFRRLNGPDPGVRAADCDRGGGRPDRGGGRELLPAGLPDMFEGDQLR